MLTVTTALVGLLAARALVHAARRLEAGQQARFLTTRRRWRVPARARGWLVDALHDAAIDLEPEQACELWLAVVLGAAIPAFALAPGLGVAVALTASTGGPIGLRVARGRARRRLVAALPAALEHVAAGLRGGVTVDEAVDALATGDGPLAPDFARVRARTSLGAGFGDALASWSAERPLPSVRAACGALAVAASVGGPAAGAIDGLAGSLRDRLGAEAEAHALSAQARLSAIVVGVAPLAFLAFSAITDLSSLRLLVGTRAGLVCLAIGLALDAAAILWMRRILQAGYR